MAHASDASGEKVLTEDGDAAYVQQVVADVNNIEKRNDWRSYTDLIIACAVFAIFLVLPSEITITKHSALMIVILMLFYQCSMRLCHTHEIYLLTELVRKVAAGTPVTVKGKKRENDSCIGFPVLAMNGVDVCDSRASAYGFILAAARRL